VVTEYGRVQEGGQKATIIGFRKLLCGVYGPEYFEIYSYSGSYSRF
jgi:hypothetical protein